MKLWLRRVIALLCIIAFVVAMNVIGGILMPDSSGMGCSWEAFAEEPENSIDVLFLGSSMVYCDVIPAQIYEESGLTSYVVAGPELTIPITYYYLREALRTQSPQAVFLEINGLFFDEYTDFTAVTVGYMPWSYNRLAATFLCAEPELRFGLLYPLYLYHSTIDPNAIASHLSTEPDLNAGFSPQYRVALPKETSERTEYRTNTAPYWQNMEYIQKIGKLCEENGIDLYLYAAPSKAVIPAEIKETLLTDLTNAGGFTLFDCNDHLDGMSLADAGDWTDSLHLNLWGAAKFSSFLAERLQELGLTPSQSGDNALWQQRVEALHTLCAEAVPQPEEES